jgi:hypothetical protein
VTTVWILARSSYDEFTLVGVYSSRELAESERDRVEALQEAHDADRPRLRSRRGESLEVAEYDLDRTGVEVIVNVRGDGTPKDTMVHLGYRSVASNYESTYQGRADTYEAALEKARASTPRPSP